MEKFGKRQTMIIKGVAVCLMLVHHLFFDETYTCDCTFLCASSEHYLIEFATLCKVCVAMFLFLSAFGLFKSYTVYTAENGISFKSDAKYVGKHILKVLVGFWWCVVPFAVIGLATGMRTFQSVYGEGGKSILYFIVDLFGLGGRVDWYKMYNITCWYLALAFALYILFPLLYRLINRNVLLFGAVCLFFGFSPLPQLILVDKIWLVPFALGMVFAKYDCLDKIMAHLHEPLTALGIVVFFVAGIFIRHTFQIPADALFAVAIILFVLLVCSKVKFVGSVAAFLGKHSMNIFMTHTFIFLYYWREFTYSFKYPILIYLFLLGSTLVYSIVLEFVKALAKKPFCKKENGLIQ